MKSRGLLLDTHALIWIVMGHEKMAKAASRKVIDTAFRERQLFLSGISLWEVSMLEAKGRIVLKEPCLDWMQTAIQKLQLEILPLSPEVAVESSRLPGGFHGDPADRIIVATGRKHRLSIVTQDDLILTYAKNGMVEALRCW